MQSHFSKYGYGYEIMFHDEARTSYAFNVKEKRWEIHSRILGTRFMDSSNDSSPEHIEFEQFEK